MKLTTLAALYTALQCSPNDLIEIDTTPVSRTTEKRPKPSPSASPVARRGRSLPPA